MGEKEREGEIEKKEERRKGLNCGRKEGQK
jgi:hypothetical protein